MMKKNFVESSGFENVKSVKEIWEWLDTEFVNGLYDGPIEYNHMVSVPRLRMQKVRPDSCVVHEDFQDQVKIKI